MKNRRNPFSKFIIEQILRFLIWFSERREIVIRTFGSRSYAEINTINFKLRIWRVIDIDGETVRLRKIL